MKSCPVSRRVLAVLCLALAGCVVGPEHRLPVIDPGAGWQAPHGEGEAAGLARWWRTLGDPVLAECVEQALAHNLELRQAAANIEAARALLARADAAGDPALGAAAAVQRRRLSTTSPEYMPARSPNQTFSDIGLDASWELDLFGGLRRQREAAGAGLALSEAEAQGLRVSLVAEVARSYFTLRGAQAERAAVQHSVATLARLDGVVRERVVAGDLPPAEQARSAARLAQARAALPALDARAEAAAIALARLGGQLPEARAALLAQPAALPEPLPLAVGQRADLLRRRPDVIAAERRLAQATAETGVATAELFPKLSLSAGAGFRALSGSDLLGWDSRRGNVAPLLSWRVLDGGRVRAEIHAAEARQQAAALGYESAVLGALADGERALSQYARSREALATQREALAATAASTAIQRQRHAAGDLALGELLDAERELAEQQAAQARQQSAAVLDLTALYKALGGGWDAN